MNPDLLLAVMAAFAGFVLKTTLAFGVCLALSRLVGSPGRRFLIWLGFLYGAAAYWLWLAERVVAGGRSSAGAQSAVVQPLTSTARSLQVPGSWTFPLAVSLLVVGTVYLTAQGYMLLIHFKKQRQLKWILRFTSSPPGEIGELFQALAERLHVGRSRLLLLPGLESPATFGWIRPTILLPDACLEQEHSELESILLHELHHVRRWDFVWNGFAVVSRALLFFHPAAWYAVRRIQFDRELACDLAVVSASPKQRVNYAECLVRFARLQSTQDPNWGIDFAGSPEHLRARVLFILSESRKPSFWSVGLRTACGLALFAGFLGIEPSLGVLLSYAKQQISQPVSAKIQTTPARVDTRTRASRKSKAPMTAAAAAPEPVASGGNRIEDTVDLSELKSEEPSSVQSAAGPKLLHRPGPGSGNSSTPSKQQTVMLIDPSSNASKAGDHDGKHDVQQSAILAGAIYRNASELNRR
jgi:beta-lactamase regulating signal transducer with metallopeptidase domain